MSQEHNFGHPRETWLEGKLDKILPCTRKVKSLDRLHPVIYNVQWGARNKNSSLKNNPPAQRHSQAPNTGARVSADTSENRRTMCSNERSRAASKVTPSQCIQTHSLQDQLVNNAPPNARGKKGLRMVDGGINKLEWTTDGTARDRLTDHHGRLVQRLGRLDGRSPSGRFLDDRVVAYAVQLQRAHGSTVSTPQLPTQHSTQMCPDRVRQYKYRSVPEQFRGPLKGAFIPSHSNLGTSVSRRNTPHSTVPSRISEHGSRQIITAEPKIRVVAKLSDIPMVRQNVGQAYHRSLRNDVKCTNYKVQQPILRSPNRSGGCLSTAELAPREQLLQSTISSVAQSPSGDQGSARVRDCNSATLANATMVSSSPENGDSAACTNNYVSKSNPSFGRKTGTPPKQTLDTPSMESIWRERLARQNWSKRATDQFFYDICHHIGGNIYLLCTKTRCYNYLKMHFETQGH